MKTDLKEGWVLMCIAPFRVDMHHRNEYTAMLLGDELCEKDKFDKMFFSGGSVEDHTRLGSGYWGDCRWCIEGNCYHPFMEGSRGDAIFAGVLSEAEGRGKPKDRPCDGCTQCLPRNIEESAFRWVELFYRHLLNDMSTTRWVTDSYDKFTERYNRYRSRKFYDFGSFAIYEDNIRRHFDLMTRRHFDLVTGARGGDELNKAIMQVRMDLAMHWMNYWVAGKYKEKEVA